MMGEWCYFKSYFNRSICDEIIHEGLKLPAQEGALGNGQSAYGNDSIRRSKVRFIQNGDWKFQHLFDSLWKTAIQANNDFFNIHITRLQFIQLAEYDESYQGEYKAHHDVFWMNGDPNYHRKLTCVIQLSDPATYEGGNLEFVDTMTHPPVNEIREQGTAIFFPSMFMHRATPVTKGTRYSIAAWFEGPKWR